jgi:methionyl-tRNA formyltransferase
MKPYRIIFLGTPNFALPSLKALVESQNKAIEVIGVVTQPDRPKGRGKKLIPPPIKIMAQKYCLPLYQPQTVKDKTFLTNIKELAPDLLVVVAFGQFLPRTLLEIPYLGGINVHPSLLPKYRGAAPINWAIICGEIKTGITIMKLSTKMDSGDILLQRAIPIKAEETAGELHDKLAQLGAEMLLETIYQMKLGTISSIAQNDSLASYAPKLKKEDALIHWDMPAYAIGNLIRGLDPLPGATTYLEGKLLKLFHPKTKLFTSSDLPPGSITQITPEGIQVATGRGLILIREVKLEGRKRLSVKEFIKGYHNLKGKRLAMKQNER